VCTFTGTVRGVSADHETAQLHYEAYTPMAEAKMKQVAAEIRERWPAVQGIAIVQRVGRLNVGEFTVLIAVSAGHRDQGVFEAARYGIDRLKEIVPVWKKEIGPGGEQWVEGHYRPTSSDVT
jgi:molybdopterin synthase catalytic subunit